MFETLENFILDADYRGNVIREGPVFASIIEALAELRAGRMIVIVDDEDRENEGDVMIAAEMITARSHQLHGDARTRSDLPGHYRRESGFPGTEPDGSPKYIVGRHRLHGVD